jgi:hypothetical protein
MSDQKPISGILHRVARDHLVYQRVETRLEFGTSRSGWLSHIREPAPIQSLKERRHLPRHIRVERKAGTAAHRFSGLIFTSAATIARTTGSLIRMRKMMPLSSNRPSRRA